MIKQADISSMLSGLKDQAQGVGSSVTDWYSSQPEAVRKALVHGLVGAGAGAALTGATAAMRKRDPDESLSSAVLSPALMGALLGGTAGAGIALGKGVLGGGIKLPGLPEPEPQPLVTRMTDPLVRGLASNLGVVGGAAAPFAFKGNREALMNTIDNGVGSLSRSGKLRLGLGVPAGMALGYLGQRALKGEY